MTEDPRALSCNQFQTLLPDLISSGKNIATHPHIEQCPICGALLDDLESISEAAHLLFPVAEPSEVVWVQIESAIEEEKGRLEPEDEAE
jgi:hypothetical protein